MEIIGTNFFCNLSSVHLNQIDPFDFAAQEKAFTASALQAAAFLNRGFTNPRYQHSRKLDPIVGVSFTGLFTFFVRAFGVDWLKWWQAGRPDNWLCFPNQSRIMRKFPVEWCATYDVMVDGYVAPQFYKYAERRYFELWRDIAHNTVWEYCDRHNLKRPNRCTTVKPEGSLTLLTGVGACGWHPPKAKHYIRRMTFGAHDPIALAAIDWGYTVVPSQSCKDDEGNLLNDPFDPRVTEWLVEVPVAEPWADLPGAEDIDPSAFPIEAQWDFYMQVQKHYTTHNTSATLEIYESEIETLGKLIHGAIANDEGYISAAILGRSDGNSTFPRMPFEPITRKQFEALCEKIVEKRNTTVVDGVLNFMNLIAKYDNPTIDTSPQDSACDSGLCEIKGLKPSSKQSGDIFKPVD